MQFCRSLETGVITMNNDIIRRVGALHDMQIEDEHILAVLCDKETILPEDVKTTIRAAAEQHTNYVLFVGRKRMFKRESLLKFLADSYSV